MIFALEGGLFLSKYARPAPAMVLTRHTPARFAMPSAYAKPSMMVDTISI